VPGLAFAVCLYLPLASLTPIFIGGLVRRMVEARRKEGPAEGDPGVLAASGMIAGEGLAGVAIAFIVAAKTKWTDSGWSRWLDAAHFAGKDFAWIRGAAGALVGIALVVGVSTMYRAGRSEETPQ
jgi:OPT oligopeptide transporter protein